MFPDELSVTREQTTEVLRPGSIDRAVDDGVTDSPCPQFLWLRRKADDCIHFTFAEEANGLPCGIRYPPDVFSGVEPDVGSDTREEDMLGTIEDLHGRSLALEV